MSESRDALTPFQPLGQQRARIAWRVHVSKQCQHASGRHHAGSRGMQRVPRTRPDTVTCSRKSAASRGKGRYIQFVVGAQHEYRANRLRNCRSSRRPSRLEHSMRRPRRVVAREQCGDESENARAGQPDGPRTQVERGNVQSRRNGSAGLHAGQRIRRQASKRYQLPTGEWEGCSKRRSCSCASASHSSAATSSVALCDSARAL